jgi:hypothetical protein
METFFVYGTTGVASAELDLKPAVAEALGCSTDLVSTKGCSGANRAFREVPGCPCNDGAVSAQRTGGAVVQASAAASLSSVTFTEIMYS